MATRDEQAAARINDALSAEKARPSGAKGKVQGSLSARNVDLLGMCGPLSAAAAEAWHTYRSNKAATAKIDALLKR